MCCIINGLWCFEKKNFGIFFISMISMNSIGNFDSDLKEVKVILIVYQKVQFAGMNFSLTRWAK